MYRMIMSYPNKLKNDCILDMVDIEKEHIHQFVENIYNLIKENHRQMNSRIICDTKNEYTYEIYTVERQTYHGWFWSTYSTLKVPCVTLKFVPVYNYINVFDNKVKVLDKTYKWNFKKHNWDNTVSEFVQELKEKLGTKNFGLKQTDRDCVFESK